MDTQLKSKSIKRQSTILEATLVRAKTFWMTFQNTGSRGNRDEKVATQHSKETSEKLKREKGEREETSAKESWDQDGCVIYMEHKHSTTVKPGNATIKWRGDLGR